MIRKEIALISLLLIAATNVNADIDAEKAKLAMIIHELEAITPLIKDAETLADKNDRIQFQYEWLSRDISNIKSAIEEHIDTPRIQPRNFPPIDNKYRN